MNSTKRTNIPASPKTAADYMPRTPVTHPMFLRILDAYIRRSQQLHASRQRTDRPTDGHAVYQGVSIPAEGTADSARLRCDSTEGGDSVL